MADSEASREQKEEATLPDEPLELPDGRDFVPAPHRPVDTEQFLEFCASLLPALRGRPDFYERRREHGVDAEFDLDHPERVPAAYNSKLLDEIFELAKRSSA